MPPQHPGRGWVSIARRKEVTNTMLIILPAIFLSLCVIPCMLCCACSASKYAGKYQRDVQRTLGQAATLTQQAVEEVFPLLPDVWKAGGIDTWWMDAAVRSANRDLIVECVTTKQQRSATPKSPAAALLMRAIPAAWVLDTNPATGILHQKDLAPLWGTSTPQTSIRTFMSHAWKADATETAAALNMHFKVRWVCLYLCVVISVAWLMTGLLPAFVSCVFFLLGVLLSYAYLFSGRQWANRPLLWMLGLSGASVWMDKATVKQCRFPLPKGEAEDARVTALNLAGVSLFPWFLSSAEELWVCHSPHYFRRLWCAYEISTWLHLKGPQKIRFVSLEYSRALRAQMRVFLLWVAVYYSTLMTYYLTFGATWWGAITDDCGQAEGKPLDDACWYGKYQTVIIVVLWIGFCPASCLLCLFWNAPLTAVRARILAELESFDVMECEQTMEADRLLVHTYILEQHESLDAFSRQVRTGVRDFVEKSLKEEHVSVTAFSFLFTFSMFWYTGIVLGASMGTSYTAVDPDFFLRWAHDDSALGVTAAIHWTSFALLIVLCLAMPPGVCFATSRLARVRSPRAGAAVQPSTPPPHNSTEGDPVLEA